MKQVPEYLLSKLEEQYGKGLTQKIVDGYKGKKAVTLRVNTLKSNFEKVCSNLEKENIEFEKVEYIPNALIIKNASEVDIQKLQMYEDGEIYLQSLSSMIPPIVLKPEEGQDILDMAAAPGGKTTQIAALTSNKSFITACEMNAIRAERLKYNLAKQGATTATVMVIDARNLDDFFSFDQILLDAPCSGSGTINLEDEYIQNFSPKFVEKIEKTQKALLKKALTVLKPGKEMVYSTCSILKRENEEIIKDALKNKKIEIVPIEFEGMENIPMLPSEIKGTLCVCPNKFYEGFFIAKLRKNK